MTFHSDLPIFILTNPERYWLQQVYDWNKIGRRFSFEHVRVALEGRIPNDFTYQEIDSRLLQHNGCSITILGIRALDPETDILNKIDLTACAIRQLILKDVDRHDLPITEISEITGYTTLHTSFYINLLSLVGHFNNGGSFEKDFQVFKTIRVGGSEKSFNNYMGYPGIEMLIMNSLRSYGPQPGAGFSHQEIFVANQKLDQIIELIGAKFEENNLEMLEIRNNINDMRNHFSLPKKNWWQMFLGKLGEMTVSGIISETLSKKIISIFSGVIHRLGF
jgi:hypothetical protein